MPTRLPIISLSILAIKFLPQLYSYLTSPAEPLFYPGLSGVPRKVKTWKIYPEDFYEGGGYANLPWGRVRFWVLGPEKGKKVVLIHGLTIPGMVWKDIAPALAERGYRVLVYDLYGRGYSDAPRMTYHTALYTTQLALLMQYLKWDKAIVAGFSMGGAIAAAFTSQFPQLVDNKVIFIASAGVIEPLSTVSRLISSPIAQTIVSSLPFRNFFHSTKVPENESSLLPIVEIVQLQSKHLPYYDAAVSSSLRDGPIRGESSAFSSEELKDREVLILQGDNDMIVQPEYATKIFSLLPSDVQSHSQLITVPGAGHDLTITHALSVVREMTSFVEKNP